MEAKTFLGKWSQFFVTRYKTTILVVVALLIAGTWGVFNNQRQDFPTIPSNYIGIQATYIGASAEDVEQEVVKPIEQGISDIDGINFIRSNSRDNFGDVTIEMSDIEGTPDALAEVDDAISGLQLPADVEVSTQIYDAVGPTIVFALVSDSADQAALISAAADIQDRLAAASSGIKEVELIPSNEFEIVIALNNEELTDNNLTSQQVSQAITSGLTSLPGGTVATAENTERTITIDSTVSNLDDLRELPVTKDVALQDVAEITRQPKANDVPRIAGYIDEEGNPQAKTAVYLQIYKKDDGDVINIAEDLKAEQAAILDEQVLPENVQLEVVFDNSTYVESQISALLQNGWMGLILIIVVLMLFINLRTGIVVATIIPLAFLGTLAMLYVLGFTINILTLFGLLLVLGILVDNAIVVAEGVMQRIEEGMSKPEAVLSTIEDLAPAVTAATATTVVVFIPFASVGGIVGAFLKYIPYTIIIMLVISYVLAITITPVLARFILKEETRDERQKRTLATWQKITIIPAVLFYAQKSIDVVEGWVEVFTMWLHARLWRKLVVIATTVVAMGISFGYFAGQLEFNQFPTSDGNTLAIAFEYPTGVSDSAKVDAINRITKKAVDVSYFQSLYMESENSFMMLLTEPAERDTDMTSAEITAELTSILSEDIDALSDTGIEISITELGVGPPTSGGDITLEITSDDLGQLEAITKDVAAYVANEADVEEVTDSFTQNTVTTVNVDLSQDDLQDNGISALQAAGVVNSVFSQSTIGSLQTIEGAVSDDIVLGYDDASTDSLDDLRELTVGVNQTVFPPRVVELQDVASVEERTSLQAIQHLDQKRVGTVTVTTVEDADNAAIEQRIQEYLTDEKLAEYNLTQDDVVFGGIIASENDNFDSLILVFMLAMVFVYLILVYQFNSYIQPGLIMFTVPLALTSVFPALVGIKESLNMVTGLGVVALVGVVVNDAIVFVDYYNRVRKQRPEESLTEVIVDTVRARFKPILSTTVTTIFGVLPLTITDPFWRGLGTSLMTGLAAATVGTLIVFPIILTWADAWLHWLSSKMQRKPKVAKLRKRTAKK